MSGQRLSMAIWPTAKDFRFGQSISAELIRQRAGDKPVADHGPTLIASAG